MDTLRELQSWYLSQCNDDWEHTYGVSVGTLDNPGWSLTIDLTGTKLSGKAFEGRRYGVDDKAHPIGNDWLHCKVERNKFVAHGGPEKLEEMINVFLDWSKAAA
jgi:hypothetical protein